MARPVSTFNTLQAQTAAGIALPAVQSTATPAVLNAAKNLSFFTVSIPPSTAYPLAVAGDFLFVDTITFAANVNPTYPQTVLTIKPDTSGQVELRRQQSKFNFPVQFTTLLLTNPNADTITLTVYIGFGQFDVQSIFNPTQVVRPGFWSAVSTLQRPANVIAYAANQSVNDAVTANRRFGAGSLSNPNLYSKITKASIFKSTNTTANANFRLWLYKADIAAIADQAAQTVLFANAADLVGVINFPSFVTSGAGSGAVCDVAGLSIQVLTATPGYIYGQLEALAAYAPGNAESFSIQLSGEY